MRRYYCTRTPLCTKYASSRVRWTGKLRNDNPVIFEPKQTDEMQATLRAIFDDYYAEAAEVSLVDTFQKQLESSKGTITGLLKESLAAETLLQTILLPTGGRKGGIDMTIRKGLLGDWEIPFEDVAMKCWADIFYPFTFKPVTQEVVDEALQIQKTISNTKLRGGTRCLVEAHLAVFCVVVNYDLQVTGESKYITSVYGIVNTLYERQYIFHPNLSELLVSTLCNVSSHLRHQRQQETDHRKKKNLVDKEQHCAEKLCAVAESLGNSPTLNTWGPSIFPYIYATVKGALAEKQLSNFVFAGRKLLRDGSIAIDLINTLHADYELSRDSYSNTFCEHVGVQIRKTISTLLTVKYTLHPILECDLWKTEEGQLAAKRLIMLLTGMSKMSDDKISWSQGLHCIRIFSDTVNKVPIVDVIPFLEQIKTSIGNQCSEPLLSEIVGFTDHMITVEDFPYSSESLWRTLIYLSRVVGSDCERRLCEKLVNNINIMSATDPVKYDPILSQSSAVNTLLRSLSFPDLVLKVIVFMEKKKLQLSQYDYIITFNKLAEDHLWNEIIDKLWLGGLGANSRTGAIRNSFIICAAHAYCMRYHSERRRPDQRTAINLIEEHLTDWVNEIDSAATAMLSPRNQLQLGMTVFKRVLPPITFNKIKAVEESFPTGR